MPPCLQFEASDGRQRPVANAAGSGSAGVQRRSWWLPDSRSPSEIGHGGFGVVYCCSQRALDRTVAVKVLTTDLEPDDLERFVREQVAMGKLSGHPHIVNIFQVGTTATGRP